MMASNFCAEVAEFFLKGRSYTTLAAKGFNDGKIKFEAGEVFGARLRMRTSYSGSRTYEYESGSSGDNTWYSQNGARAYRADFYGGGTDVNSVFREGSPANYSQDPGDTGDFEIPQDPKQNPYYKQNFVMYNRTTAFGPPFSNRYPARYGKSGELSGIAYLVNEINFPWTASADYYDKPNTFMSMSNYGVMDCFNGYNWGWTPPYYHGEAWCDFIFRPSGGVEYDTERILAEVQIQQWRCDPGPRTGSEDPNAGRYDRTLWRDCLRPTNEPRDLRLQNTSPYNSYNINQNAMQLNSSLNLFGVQPVYKKVTDKFGNTTENINEIVGKSWAIQPKFETPMLNFSDTGIRPVTGNTSTKTLPENFGAETTPSGIWHQFGTVPESPDHGIFLEIGDIPAKWLKNHYSVVSESSVYNGYNDALGKPGLGSESWTTGLENSMKSFANLMGFDSTNSKVRLGEISHKKVVREAIVVVPYIENALIKTDSFITPPSAFDDVVDVTETVETFTTVPGMSAKNFINIPLARFNAALESSAGTPSGDSLDAAGISIRRLIQKMKRYVLPPQFDFINNPTVSPIVMYMLEFEYEFDRDDLSYMWQNIAPRNYKRMSFQKDCVAHELIDTELLNADNLFENPNLRWMVFKVKQRSQSVYNDKIIEQANRNIEDPFQLPAVWQMSQNPFVPKKQKLLDNVLSFKSANRKEQEPSYEIKYNWPYDYFSFVELAKIDVEVLFNDGAAALYYNAPTDVKVSNMIVGLKGTDPNLDIYDKEKEKKENEFAKEVSKYAALQAEEAAKVSAALKTQEAHTASKQMKVSEKNKLSNLRTELGKQRATKKSGMKALKSKSGKKGGGGKY